MAKLALDCLYAEVTADDEGQARRRVDEALARLPGPGPGGAGWSVLRVLADPSGGRFGVEVVGPPLPPPLAWLGAHALARELGGDAHVEACFRGDVAVGERDEHGGARGPELPARPATTTDAPRDVRWHLARINVAAAHEWLRARGRDPGEGVVIGHPDTGYTTHPAVWADGGRPLAAERGQNLLELDRDPTDPRTANPVVCQPGHGTKTASLIVGRSDGAVVRVDDGEAVSMLGIAPAAVVVPFRVTDSVVILGWQRRLAEAIEAAVERGCHVISMSLGGIGGSRLDRAIRLAESRGVIVVAAAGNGVPFVVAPGDHPLVVACAASTHDDRPWPKSSSGRAVNITAPGAEVWGAAWDGERAVVERGSGTSFATAAVAAAAALWRCAHAAELAAIPAALHPALFRSALRATARAVDALPPERYGGGILDCAALVARPIDATAIAEAQAAVAAFAREHDASAPAIAAVADDAIPDGKEPPPALRDALAKLAELSRAARAELAFQLQTDPSARASWRPGHDGPPRLAGFTADR